MTIESRRKLKPNTQCAGGTSSDANKIYSNRSFSVIDLADGNQGDIIASQLHMVLPTVCDTPEGSSERVDFTYAMLLVFMFAAVYAS